MYKTAVYLSYAQRLRRELAHGRSRARSTLQAESKLCLESVRRALHGDGNDMVDDLQDLLGESMWDLGAGVIGYHDFRERILSEVGWDQFTELFRFYIHFHMKLGYQVEATRQELRKFCAVLEKVVRIERQRFARLRSLGHAIAHTASKAWVRMQCKQVTLEEAEDRLIIMGEQFTQLRLHLQPDHTAILRFPIAFP
jgi:hypothetical protein